jgi:hypothetical protein
VELEDLRVETLILKFAGTPLLFCSVNIFGAEMHAMLFLHGKLRKCTKNFQTFHTGFHIGATSTLHLSND